MDLATVEPVTSRARPSLRLARRRPQLREVTAAIVLAHLVAVSWLVIGGDLYIDDIRAQAYAAGRDPWPFVIESNGTHLAPGARTVDWLMATYAPLQHWPAVLITVSIAALVGWSARRLVTQVIANPVGQVLALSWVLFAASVIPTYAWFRQALTTMLALGLVLLATSLVIDHLRTRRLSTLVWAVGCHALALTFSERAVAVPVVVFSLLLVTSRVDPRRSWRRAGATLAPFVVVNVMFLAIYTRGEFDTAEGSQPSWQDAAVKIGRWVVVDLLPSYLGGPVVWRAGNVPYSFAATPTILVVAALVTALALLMVATRTRGALRRALPVAIVAAGYAVPVLGLIYVGRLAQVTDIRAADDLRLLPDVSAAVAIALGALVGAVDERRRAGDWDHRWRRPQVLAALAAGTVVVLATTTWVTFGRAWHDAPVTSYLSSLRVSLADSTGPLLPTPVPAEIIPGWVESSFTTRPLIQLLKPDAMGSLMPGSPEIIGPSGSVVAGQLTRVAAAPVPAGFCGAVLEEGEQSVTLPLRADAPYYRGSVVALGLIVGDATRVNVTVTDRDGVVSEPLVQAPPELLRGPHRIYALVPEGTAVTAITVVVETPNTEGVCVTSAQINTIGTAS